MTDDLQKLRYPVGRFERLAAPPTRAMITGFIDTIEQTPARFRALVSGRTETQLDTPYRPGGWTVRQVIHHVPDSHLNAYVRMKLGVTEDTPPVKPYDETRWAELPDGKSGPADMSLALLESLHRRWVMFLKNLSDDDFRKAVLHPEWGRIELGEILALYAWHCRHHEGHIKLGIGG